MNEISTFGKIALSIWIVVVFGLIAKHIYISILRYKRDRIDLSTDEGLAAAKHLNRKIDRANGFRTRN